MCLYGNDMDETTTLVEAGLGWIVSLDEAQGRLPGPRRARSSRRRTGPPRKLVGFEVIGRGIARHGYPVYLGDEAVGAVTSGTYAPFLQKNIGLVLPARRAAPRSAPSSRSTSAGRKVPARVVPTPFYKRPR